MMMTTGYKEQSRTERNLLSGLWRQQEGEQEQDGHESARYDEVECVVERSTPDVDRVRNIDVRLVTALVGVNSALHWHAYIHRLTIRDLWL